MKILNNSDKFPTMSNAELIKELSNLDNSLKLATELGTGTSGIETIISQAEQELISRGVDSDDVKLRISE
jgi:hypothetical protein